ncbi:MAG: hypothetical protein WBC33_04905, partial [Conexibacter sp.]
MSADLIAAYAGGSVTQAALVAGGGVRCVPRSLRTLRHPLFGLMPLVALVGVAVGLRAAPGAASALAQLALVAVPLLALLAAARLGLPVLAIAIAMLILVLHDSHSLAGQ